MENTNANSLRIGLDYNNMMADALDGGRGITRTELEAFVAKNSCAIKQLAQKRPNMQWCDLPHNQGEVVAQLLKTASRIQQQFDAFVVLGIGGSALGPIAIQQALKHYYYNELPASKRNAPKLYVIDNIDPDRMSALFDVLDIKRTMFNVITKSGNTPETMAQFLIVSDMLKKTLGEAWTHNMIITTDKAKGNLLKLAKANDIETFCIPDGVGGRFSELCPVGLLPAAICGIDIAGLLNGACYMDELCTAENPHKNPAFMLAALDIIALRKGCNINVMMPYSDALKYFSDWYAQLWAESLGKRRDLNGNDVFVGQTPVKALGVTDQHSQVQLYTEGPFDKLVTFIRVGKFDTVVNIPHAVESTNELSYLCGHTLNELINTEQAATEYAIQKSGHMNKTIYMPQINAFTVGQLIYMLEVATAFAGEFLNIDAFDQPGVEEGKNATYAILGRTGYDGFGELPKHSDEFYC